MTLFIKSRHYEKKLIDKEFRNKLSTAAAILETAVMNIDMANTDEQITNTSELTALEVAKFIFSKKMDQHSIQEMAEELDSNKRLLSEIICFFIEIGWIRSNTNGTYAITTKMKI
jgi:hypothetical protein